MVNFLSISAQSDDTLNTCLSDVWSFNCMLPTLQADFLRVAIRPRAQKC